MLFFVFTVSIMFHVFTYLLAASEFLIIKLEYKSFDKTLWTSSWLQLCWKSNFSKTQLFKTSKQNACKLEDFFNVNNVNLFFFKLFQLSESKVSKYLKRKTLKKKRELKYFETFPIYFNDPRFTLNFTEKACNLQFTSLPAINLHKDHVFQFPP